MTARTGKTTLNHADICEFLNTVNTENERNRRDVQSIWSKVRRSLKEFGLRVDFNEEGATTLVHDESQTVITPKGRKWPLNTLLSNIKHNLRLNALLQNKDQGNTFHLVSKNINSNKFLSTGGGMSFSCYRFACRGRLNLLPTKTVVKRSGRSVQDTLCPTCKQHPDMLAHTLNACMRNAAKGIIK